MRAGRGDAQAHPLGRLGQLAAGPDNFFGELFDRRADLRADLDDRLVHLALDVIAERRRARGEQLRHVGPQLPRVRVDDLELFLDTDREGVMHRSVIIARRPSAPARRRAGASRMNTQH